MREMQDREIGEPMEFLPVNLHSESLQMRSLEIKSYPEQYDVVGYPFRIRLNEGRKWVEILERRGK